MLVTDHEHLDHILSCIEEMGYLGDPIAVDTETTGLNIYQDDHMLGMSLSYGLDRDREDWYIPVAHVDTDNFSVKAVVEALAAHPGLLIFHNAEFDWSVIEKETGIDLSTHEFWDTQAADWLMDENLPHGLKEVGARLFGMDEKGEQKALKAIMRGRTQAQIYTELRNGDDERWTGKGTAKAAREEAARLAPLTHKTWATLTGEDIAPYASQDTALTLRAYYYQREEIELAEPPIPPEALDREFAFQRVLYKMMRVGIQVDPGQAQLAAYRAMHRMEEIEPVFGGINLNSPKQLAALIYDEWGAPIRNRSKKTGAPSTDRATLEELEGAHPNISLLLEYRSLSKAVGTYFAPLIEKRDAGNRVHTHFNAHRTVTGRLSSSDPNLQNIPKASTNAEVRAMFIPAPGLELWEFDLAAAEMRVMAGWSQDPALIAAVMDPEIDVHRQTADGIWGADVVGESEDTIEKYRTLAKNVGYGYPYGIGPGKVAVYIVKGTGQPVNEAYIAQGATIIRGYERTYPGLARLMKGMQRVAEQEGYIPLHVPGRYRRYRGPGYRVWETYTALNSAVQGGIGEFMKDVMLEVDRHHLHGGAGCFRMCLQVHDSLVCEVVPGRAPEVLLTLQEIADRINPFPLRMEWDAKQRGA